MTPLGVVTWRWRDDAYRSAFDVDTVNVLRRMVSRHYDRPHRFLCVTDDAVGLDPNIEVVPPWNDFVNLPNPHGRKKPSCYRRLRAFHPDIGDVFGPRFVSLDLDVVITGDLRPLWDRKDEFIIHNGTCAFTPYNGSMFLLTAGARRQVWDDFDPVQSPARTKVANMQGSDQSWISLRLGPDERTWSTRDGVYSFRNHVRSAPEHLPPDARLVVFSGASKPWDPQIRHRIRWVQHHYC